MVVFFDRGDRYVEKRRVRVAHKSAFCLWLEELAATVKAFAKTALCSLLPTFYLLLSMLPLICDYVRKFSAVVEKKLIATLKAAEDFRKSHCLLLKFGGVWLLCIELVGFF